MLGVTYHGVVSDVRTVLLHSIQCVLRNLGELLSNLRGVISDLLLHATCMQRKTNVADSQQLIDHMFSAYCVHRTRLSAATNSGNQHNRYHRSTRAEQCVP